MLLVLCFSRFFGVRFREHRFSLFVHRTDASEGLPPTLAMSLTFRRVDGQEGPAYKS